MEKSIDLLLKNSNYEDLLLLYTFNHKKLKPFPKFIENLDEIDRDNILEFILKAKTPNSMNLRKIMLSNYFYEVLKIDEIVS